MAGCSRLTAAACLAALAAACASKPAPAPAPPPVRPQTARPLPPPPPPAPAPGWEDAPLSPGGWTYAADAAGSRAAFGTTPASPAFVLRCDAAARRVALERRGAAGIAVRTTSSVRALPAAGGAASLAAGDPLLDAMAFSRGRFMVEAAGAAPLILPAWPELARVVEDCRS